MQKWDFFARILHLPWWEAMHRIKWNRVRKTNLPNFNQSYVILGHASIGKYNTEQFLQSTSFYFQEKNRETYRKDKVLTYTATVYKNKPPTRLLVTDVPTNLSCLNCTELSPSLWFQAHASSILKSWRVLSDWQWQHHLESSQPACH